MIANDYKRCNRNGDQIADSKEKKGKTILDKIKMLPRAVVELARAAWLPRLRHNFISRDIELDFVDPVIACRLREPRSMTERLRQRSGLKLDSKASAVFSEKEDRLYESWYAGEPYRHAEVAVILYSMAWPISGTRMCNYIGVIGVNKLACLCCEMLLKAINKALGTQWTTGGAHGKLYPYGALRANDYGGGTGGETGGDQTAPSEPGGRELSPLFVIERRVLSPQVLRTTADLVAKEFARCCDERYGVEDTPSDAGSDSGTEQRDAGPVQDLKRHKFVTLVAAHANGE